jgi:hypothetical protein
MPFLLFQRTTAGRTESTVMRFNGVVKASINEPKRTIHIRFCGAASLAMASCVLLAGCTTTAPVKPLPVESAAAVVADDLAGDWTGVVKRGGNSCPGKLTLSGKGQVLDADLRVRYGLLSGKIHFRTKYDPDTGSLTLADGAMLRSLNAVYTGKQLVGIALDTNQTAEIFVFSRIAPELQPVVVSR